MTGAAGGCPAWCVATHTTRPAHVLVFTPHACAANSPANIAMLARSSSTGRIRRPSQSPSGRRVGREPRLAAGCASCRPRRRAATLLAPSYLRHPAALRGVPVRWPHPAPPRSNALIRYIAWVSVPDPRSPTAATWSQRHARTVRRGGRRSCSATVLGRCRYVPEITAAHACLCLLQPGIAT